MFTCFDNKYSNIAASFKFVVQYFACLWTFLNETYSGIFCLTHYKQFHKCLTQKPILPNSNLEIGEIDFHK